MCESQRQRRLEIRALAVCACEPHPR